MIIKTARFILRPFKKNDAQDITNNINNKMVVRYLSGTMPHPYKLADAKKFLIKQFPFYRQKKPLSYVFAIVIAKEVCGGIGLHHIKFGHKAEMGYWLSQKHWGKGIMSAAVKEVDHFGRQYFKLRRIEAKVFLPNVGSKKVLQHNGFQLEGIMKKDAQRGRQFFDSYLLAKVT